MQLEARRSIAYKHRRDADGVRAPYREPEQVHTNQIRTGVSGGGLETWWPRLCLDTPGKTITLDELDRIPELVSIIVNH
jgi:hypothetical protein